jgi:ribosomal protein L2
VAVTSGPTALVDFKRRKWDVPATVERLEYDPNRTAFIALIKYEDGELATSWLRSACPKATPLSSGRKR